MVVRSVAQVWAGRALPVSAAILALLAATAPAQARGHLFHRHAFSQHVPHAARVALGDTGPNFSAIVVDANSGRTLYGVNEDAPRHPASITKVMTLYLLFEQLQNGRISLDSPLQVSAHAAAQAPTKLGLRPGSTIAVENAIKAIVTKSANDMAVAVAENLAGDEVSFAQLMTQKAHSLGMTHTFYHNASGLPDMRQITTARDLALLGRAIHDRFPHYYHYFSTPSFTYAGSFMPNHNHLMSRVTGMDGIKTGYTNASGFNLLSSVNRGGRHIVSVVMGGKTAASRDNIMQSLIEGHIEEASAGPTPHVAEGSSIEEAAPTPVRFTPEPRVMEHAPTPDRGEVAEATDADGVTDSPIELHPPRGPSLIAPEMAVPAPPLPSERPRLAAVHFDPVRQAHANEDRPRPAFIAGAPKVVDPSHLPLPLAVERGPLGDGSTNRRVQVASANTAQVASATPSSLHWVTGPAPVRRGPNADEAKVTASSKAQPIGLESSNDKTGSLGSKGSPTVGIPHDEGRSPNAKGDWVIQIGATDNAGAAAELLSRARSESRVALASAKPFTEKVQKGDSTLYRARFAGLAPAEAETACKTLKRSGFACFATRN